MSQALSTANIKDFQTRSLEALDEIFLALILIHWNIPAEYQPTRVLSHLPWGFRWCDLLPKEPTQPVSSALWPWRGAVREYGILGMGSSPVLGPEENGVPPDTASELRLLCTSTSQTGMRPKQHAVCDKCSPTECKMRVLCGLNVFHLKGYMCNLLIFLC